MSSTSATSTTESITNTIKDGVNYVSESVMGKGEEAKKEQNKSVAKDSNASVGDRLSSGVDAVGAKVSQEKHEGKASAHQTSMNH